MGQRQRCLGEWRMVSSRCHHIESCQYTHGMAAQHHFLYTDNTSKHMVNPHNTLTHNQTRVCGENKIGFIPENE